MHQQSITKLFIIPFENQTKIIFASLYLLLLLFPLFLIITLSLVPIFILYFFYTFYVFKFFITSPQELSWMEA